MPLTGASLSPANVQFGGDGDRGIGQGSPPRTVTGTFGGTGNTAGMPQAALTGSSGATYSFSQVFAQNLSQDGNRSANLPRGAQDFLNGLTPGDKVDVAVIASTLRDQASDSVADVPVACFASGTLIATARGEVAVEELRVGDLVVTAQGGAVLQPVIWMGYSRVELTRHPRRHAAVPVLITAGALAEGMPHRDLRVSPDHGLLVDGYLVPAGRLVNGRSIVREMWCPEVTYWHVELPAHGLLVAEGAVAESYFDDGNRSQFDNYGITTLFKDFAARQASGRYRAQACRPVLEEGEVLDRIRTRLMERAGAPNASGTPPRRVA